MTKVIFCHGLESGPEGRKAQALRAAGFDLVAPDFRGERLLERVAKLAPILQSHPHSVLVGSSYGGLTALCTAIAHVEQGGTLHGLVLLAPALHHHEPPAQTLEFYPPVPTIVVHGVHDDVVPLDWSEAFVRAHPSVELIKVNDGHRLAESLDVIVKVVRTQLERV